MGKKQLLTTDRQAFLDFEYEHIYAKVFRTRDEFEKEMEEYIKQCIHCGSFHWLSSSKRCDCDYQHAQKTHYDDKQKAH